MFHCECRVHARVSDVMRGRSSYFKKAGAGRGEDWEYLQGADPKMVGGPRKLTSVGGGGMDGAHSEMLDVCGSERGGEIERAGQRRRIFRFPRKKSIPW
ncbi:hypothetical protein ACLOJK_001555 [Asimina triloba]